MENQNASYFINSLPNQILLPYTSSMIDFLDLAKPSAVRGLIGFYAKIYINAEGHVLLLEVWLPDVHNSVYSYWMAVMMAYCWRNLEVRAPPTCILRGISCIVAL